jgi:mRNA interferase MazF
VVRRGEIWWADYGPPRGSEAGYRRPLVIVSANALNESNLRTVLTIPVTANLTRERYSGNVRLPADKTTGLSKTAVAIVSLVSTTNRSLLGDRIGRVPDGLMADIDRGLRFVLAL